MEQSLVRRRVNEVKQDGREPGIEACGDHGFGEITDAEVS